MKHLVRKFVKCLLYVVLVYCFANIIKPSAIIDMDTSDAFSKWIYGNVTQENFEDLRMVVWGLGSLFAAFIGYRLIMWVMKMARTR